MVPFKRIGAIDLGTNSFHAVIVDIFPDGSFRTVDTLKEMVVLAKGGLGKALSEGAIKRGMRALKNIKLLCENQGAEDILAYATSAIREAENGGEFIQKAIDELGIKINAIPGKLEAELIGYAVQHGLRLDEKPVIIVDIGGGSVEFIIANNKEFFDLASLKLGVSRMTDTFKPSDPISQSDILKLRKHFITGMESIKSTFLTFNSEVMIGCSGTMQAIGLMIAHRENRGSEIMINELDFTDESFKSFYKSFIKLDKQGRAKIKGLDEKRLEFIVAGVVLVDTIIETFGIKKIRISDQALREGIIIRYLKRELIGLPTDSSYRDPRKRSIYELLRKTHWHEAHSLHVTNMALEIFDHLRGELDLGDNDRELLEYAGYMHDIGYYISHNRHHKHALYIIRNAELKGFKEIEIEIMANVARYHRRSTPKKRHSEYWNLRPEIRKRIKKLAGILRVADGLDRSHYQNVKRLDLELNDKEFNIRIWTEADPQLEIWGALRKSYLLSEVLSRKVQVVAKDMAVIG